MKTLITSFRWILGALIGCAAIVAHAQESALPESLQALQARGLRVVGTFDFSTASGPGLTQARSQPVALRWTHDIPGTTFVADRGLRVRAPRGDQDPASMLPLPDLTRAAAVWLFVQLNSWSFDPTESKAVYFGFGQRADRFSGVVQFRLRSAGGQVDVTYEALRANEGATSGRPITIGYPDQSEPMNFALEYQPAQQRYALYRVHADGALELLGEGKSSPVRVVRVAQMLVRGNFATTAEEYLDVGAIGVAVIENQPSAPIR
ncbi:MAG: hypothetical protein NDI75_03880 [Candidatus Didemnitutus sp.]|nr:hypothetical protein [Candidatus Didemnitutus sp.]